MKKVSKYASSLWQKLKEHPLAKIGPGLITGVADDDPSGVVTYSQAGAQFGLNMLWTMPLAFPLMAAVQSICARIGRVTGKGLAANIKDTFSPTVLKVVIILLLIANTLNIAADIAAMGEVAELVTGYSRNLMTVIFVIGTLTLQVFVPYHRYIVFLKWLTFSLLAYFGVVLLVDVPWLKVLKTTVWPQLTLSSEAATVVVALFGTTISPYLFFWQASEEVEDMHLHASAKPLTKDPRRAPVELTRINWDTWAGMFYSNITAFFVILATAVTLHAKGETDIQTAAQAASALKPIAGDFAFFLFGIGILGVGFIGVPVLAGSAGYAFAEAFGFKSGLDKKLRNARQFYGTILFCVLAGLAIQFTPMSPMKALFWSAVINGIVAVPLLIIIILLGSRKSVLKNYTSGKVTLGLAVIATLVMGAAAIRMLLGFVGL